MKKKVLIISAGSDSVSYDQRLHITSDLAAAVTNMTDLDVECTMLEKLVFEINVGRPSVRNNGTDLAEYDAVYVKNWFSHEPAARAVAQYSRQKNVTLICSELFNAASQEKLSEGFLLAGGGLLYPNTLYSEDGSLLLKSVLEHSSYSFPLVVKSIFGFKGRDNHLVYTEQELRTLLGSFTANKYMVQEYIPNNGDFRLLVMGEEVVFALHRKRIDSTTHLNNTSQGASADIIEQGTLPQEYIKYATSASKLLGREVAGVDLLVSSIDRRVFVCEVNTSPQIQTGAYTSQKIHALAEYLQRLAVTTKRHNQQTIGVSSLVDISGYTSLKQIPARIDTGARTSSMWATNIKIKDGVATFRLFGPSSQWYTGKVIRKRVIELREVTSSSGHTESRHLVELPIRMHGKRINAKFTLSDRSQQTYPILIGRNTLRGNFLVDSADPGEAKLYKYPQEEFEFSTSEAA